MEDRFDEVMVRLDELAAGLAAVRVALGAVGTPDLTVGVAEAVRAAGVTPARLHRLTDLGVFTDARPVAERRGGVPRRWWRAELAAYHEGGEAAVRAVKNQRGRA